MDVKVARTLILAPSRGPRAAQSSPLSPPSPPFCKSRNGHTSSVGLSPHPDPRASASPQIDDAISNRARSEKNTHTHTHTESVRTPASLISRPCWLSVFLAGNWASCSPLLSFIAHATGHKGQVSRVHLLYCYGSIPVTHPSLVLSRSAPSSCGHLSTYHPPSQAAPDSRTQRTYRAS